MIKQCLCDCLKSCENVPIVREKDLVSLNNLQVLGWHN